MVVLEVSEDLNEAPCRLSKNDVPQKQVVSLVIMAMNLDGQ